MANVRLTLVEAHGELPHVCMVCGQAADNTQEKKFAWHPPGIFIFLLFGVLPWAILALFLTKRAVVMAPLCRSHQGHWRNRTLFVVTGLFAVIGFLFVVALPAPPDRQDLMLLLWAALFLVWAVATIALQLSSVRPRYISDTEIYLKGVSPIFVDALVQGDDGGENDDDDFPPSLGRGAPGDPASQEIQERPERPGSSQDIRE